MSEKTQVIVIAWTETIMIHDGEPWAADLGERPGMVEQVKPNALVWINKGTAEHLASAQKYAAVEGYQVITYDSTEKDPLNRARRDILDR